MKIVVLVKEVPDTYGDRQLTLETGLADRGASDPVLDEIGERALEVALSYADAHPGTEVVAITMGRSSAGETMRKALAMGADRIVHVTDDALAGADLGLTAEVLAAVVARDGFDLVITGNVSTDGAGGIIPAMVASHLDVPVLTALSTVAIGENSVLGTRTTDAGTMRATVALPAVISITEALPEGRFPSFKGIMAAKKKPYETLTASDLNIGPEALSSGRSIIISIAQRPPRTAGTKVVDQGTAGNDLVEFLAQRRLV